MSLLHQEATAQRVERKICAACLRLMPVSNEDFGRLKWLMSALSVLLTTMLVRALEGGGI